MAIATSTEYKTHAKITHSGLDAQIVQALDTSESEIEQFVGVDDFGTATYTDQAYDGDGDHDIVLRNWPVTSVSSVKIKIGTSTCTLSSESYAVSSRGRLHRNGPPAGFAYTEAAPDLGVYVDRAVWPVGFHNILVTYIAGNATIPSYLKAIQFEMVDAILASSGRDPSVQSESIESYSYSLRSSGDRWADWSKRMEQLRRYDA